MPYGILKCDNITFDQGGADQNVTVSGIYRAITSGVTVTGTISGVTIIGTTTVSGATVTGTTVQGTTVQGVSGTFTSLTGTTTTGTTANFASGVFTTRVSGTTITGTTAQFTSGTFVSLTGTTITGTTISGTTVSSTTGTFTSITGTTITGTTVNGTTVNSITGNFTSLTGITVTGTTANFTSGVFTTQVSGLTVTGTQSSFTSGNFVTLSGATATFTSGVIASGTAAAPSLSIISDPNTGLYSPGADQVAISTGGVERLRIYSDGLTTTANTTVLGGNPAARWSKTVMVADAAIQAAQPILNYASADGSTRFGYVYHTGTGGDLFLLNQEAGAVRFGTSNTERARITSAGLVGIGTSAPYSRLTVVPASNPTTPATANQITIGESSANSAYRLQLGYFQATQYRGSIQSYDNNLPYDLILNGAGGNVGIGTTSPGVNLDVSSASNTTIRATTTDATGASIAGIQLDQNGSGASSLVVRAGSNYTILSATTSTPLLFGTNNTERARIDSSGRLLVGTSTASTAPGSLIAKLQVQGTSVFDTGITNVLWEASTNPAQLQLIKSRGASIGTHTVVQDNDTLGRILFGGSDGTDFETGAWIQCQVDGTPGTNDMPGRLIFSTTADGAASPTERLRITSAGVLQIADAGNITVGTTTGTKIGTATTQKLGFYNATPVVQPTAVADATTAVDVITQLNALLAKLRTLGIIAT